MPSSTWTRRAEALSLPCGDPAECIVTTQSRERWDWASSCFHWIGLISRRSASVRYNSSNRGAPTCLAHSARSRSGTSVLAAATTCRRRGRQMDEAGPTVCRIRRPFDVTGVLELADEERGALLGDLCVRQARKRGCRRGRSVLPQCLEL